jgi:hypothetical protein
LKHFVCLALVLIPKDGVVAVVGDRGHCVYCRMRLIVRCFRMIAISGGIRLSGKQSAIL